MSVQSEVSLYNAKLQKLAPFGYSYSVHIRFALPLLHHQTYPEGWAELYAEEAYALRDPIIAWGFSQTGTSRWSEFEIPDPFEILSKARNFDMNYGFAVACGPIKSRTIASAARPDQEFSNEEMEEFSRIIHQIHDLSEPPNSLTKAQIDALRLIAEGDRHAAAAAKLDISESALKARLSSARTNLHARTTAEAIQRARDFRLL